MKHFDPAKYAKTAKAKLGHQLWFKMGKTPGDADYQLYGDENLSEKDKKHLATFIPMAAWTNTRGIYKFDQTLREIILESQPLKLDSFILSRLPEWGVYIELNEKRYWQGIEDFVYGAFISGINSDDESGIAQITVHTAQIVAHRSFVIVQPGGYSIEGSVRDFIKDKATLDTIYPPYLEELLSYAVYLCATSPDIRNPIEPKLQPKRQKNNGPVRQWEVGYRFGAAFRKQLAEAEQRASAGHAGEHNRPRVHVRRAHWHTFLTGPRDQDRKRDVRWMPPVIVNGNSEDLPTTIWRQT